MKLDVNSLRYLSKDEWRVLGSVELGQKNHELVPKELIVTIANLKHAGAEVYISNLCKYKLLHKESRKYEGYRLTYLGYDFLAIHTLVKKGVINSVGRQIGVGKESDVYEVLNDEGEVLALKLHRLGRTSFRAVKSKRDYLQHRTSFSWLYLSRLAAMKEYAFMVALGEHGLPVPYAVAHNRHCVLMTMIDAVPLVQVRELINPGEIYKQCMGMMARLAQLGLVHCDFNEFNLLVNDEDELTLIDFPQMVSTNHANAQELFERDVECVIRFFKKKLGYIPEHDESVEHMRPDFQAIVADSADGEALDVELSASGFGQHYQEVLDRYIHDTADNAHQSSEASDNTSDTDGADSASDISSEHEDSGTEVQSEMGRLRVTDAAEPDSLATQTALQQHDTVTDAQSKHDNGDPDHMGMSGVHDQEGMHQEQHADDHVPDHVLIRGKKPCASPQAAAEAADDDIDDSTSTVSHISNRPGQAAVQQRVLDQHRSRLRKQMLARATRNAQKSGSKKDRKQAAGQADW